MLLYGQIKENGLLADLLKYDINYSVHKCENTSLPELCQDQKHTWSSYFLNNAILLPNYLYLDCHSMASAELSQAATHLWFAVDCFKDAHKEKQVCSQYD